MTKTERVLQTACRYDAELSRRGINLTILVGENDHGLPCTQAWPAWQMTRNAAAKCAAVIHTPTRHIMEPYYNAVVSDVYDGLQSPMSLLTTSK